MPKLETLTSRELAQHVKQNTLAKARSYVGRVQNATRSGERLAATVRGTSQYQVEVAATADGFNTNCTCLYSWGGMCKHAAALLLKWIEAPAFFHAQSEADRALNLVDGYPFEVIVQKPAKSTRPKELPTWLKQSFVDQRQQQRAHFSQILQSATVAELRSLADLNNWTVRGTRKADIAEQLIEKLCDPAEIERAIGTLDAEHQQALVAVGVLGNLHALAFAVFEALAESWGALKKHKRFNTYLDHLYEAGLILYNQHIETHPYYGEQAFIHRTRLPFFRPLLGGLIASSVDLPQDQNGELQIANASDLLQKVDQLVMLLEHNPIELRPPPPRPVIERFQKRLTGWDFEPTALHAAEKQGLLTSGTNLSLPVIRQPRALADESLVRLLPLIGDEAQVDFLYALLVAVGLVQPGSPVTVWPEVKTEYLRRSEAERRALLARAYFALGPWNEAWEVLRSNPSLKLMVNLLYYDSPKREQSLDKLLVLSRQLVLSTLAWLPDDEWLAVADLVAVWQKFWPQFDHKFWTPNFYAYQDTTAAKHGAWFWASGDRALDGSKLADWQVAQGNFVRAILQGPLHWLGLADLHLVNGVLTHVRLHNLADLFWDRVEAPALLVRHSGTSGAAVTTTAAAPKDAITVEGDTIRVVPSAVSSRVHSLLERIASLEATQPKQFVYRLNVAVVHRSFEAGIALSDLLEEWKRLLGSAMPKRLADRLKLWWSNYGQVRLYENLTIIELGDDHALTEMKAMTSLNSVMIGELSPRLVIIPKEAVEPLIAELEKAGYTPKRAG